MLNGNKSLQTGSKSGGKSRNEINMILKTDGQYLLMHVIFTCPHSFGHKVSLQRCLQEGSLYLSNRGFVGDLLGFLKKVFLFPAQHDSLIFHIIIINNA